MLLLYENCVDVGTDLHFDREIGRTDCGLLSSRNWGVVAMYSEGMPTTFLRVFSLVCTLSLLGCGASNGRSGMSLTAIPGGPDREGADEVSLRAKVAKGGLGVQRARRQLAAVLRLRLQAVPKVDAHAAATVELMREIVSLTPKDKQTRLRYGRALMFARTWGAALKVLEADNSCESCLELRPDLYLEDGLAKLALGDGEGASISFERTYSLRHGPVSLLMRARVFAVLGDGKADDAVFALQRALTHEPFSAPVGRDYLDVLMRVAIRAADRGDSSAVEQTLLLFPKRVEASERVVNELVLRAVIGVVELAAGDVQEARERHRVLSEDLQSFPENSRIVSEFTGRISDTFVELAAHESDAGRPEVAQDILNAGMMLVEDQSGFEIFALILASRDDPSKAITELRSRRGERSPELRQALAELLATRALQQVRAGKVRSASKDVREAKKLDDQLPSVHLASASVLAASRVSGLPYKAVREALKRGAVTYPDGRVVRFAEALLELRVARNLQRGPFATQLSRFLLPSLNDRIFVLDGEIRMNYPLEVTPSSDGRAKVILRHGKPTSVTVRISVNRGRFRELEILPGEGAEVDLSQGGVLSIDDGDERMSIVAEPGARILAVLSL